MAFGTAYKAGQTLRFTYNSENVRDRFKEVFVLQPNFQGKMHAIDLKRLTEAERRTLYTVMDPKQYGKRNRIPLVNDIFLRMNPSEEIKNPLGFYVKFVKPFLRYTDAYRTYYPMKMASVQVVRQTELTDKAAQNSKPLFKKL